MDVASVVSVAPKNGLMRAGKAAANPCLVGGGVSMERNFNLLRQASLFICDMAGRGGWCCCGATSTPVNGWQVIDKIQLNQ
jgi:hypothetical protein